MEKKPRFRGPNFTNSETLLLRNIISKYKTIIENKKTDGATLQQKKEAWIKIMKEFNAVTSDHHRTVESLQTSYKNLKKKAKKISFHTKMDILDDQQPTYAIIATTENTQVTDDEPSTYFMNDRANLNSGTQDLLTRKRKLQSETPEKQSESENFKVLTDENIEFIDFQKELLQIKLIEEQEKLEHNRSLRTMELEDARKKYAHNEKVRKLELEKILLNKHV